MDDYRESQRESQTERMWDEIDNLGEEPDYRHIRHFGKDDTEEELEKTTDY